MKIRTGIDIIEVSRVRENIENYGEKFLNRVFTQKEIEYCESKKIKKYESYAGRFAAKEAVFKAISELLENKFSLEWTDIEVINDNRGKPEAQLKIKSLDNINIDISISHIKELAVASVIVYIKE